MPDKGMMEAWKKLDRDPKEAKQSAWQMPNVGLTEAW